MRRSILALAVLAALLPATVLGGGPPSPAPARYLVLALANPERIAVLDLATGRVAERRLAGGTLCRSRLHLVGERIVYMSPGRRSGRVMSVDVALRERPRFLAHADVMTPSATPGRLWLGVRTDRGRLRIRQLWVASRFNFRARHTAPLAPLLGAVSEGLVLGGRRSTFVFDPQSGRRLRGTPGAFLIATHGSQIASCGGACTTLLLADGRRGRLVHAPEGLPFIATNGSFSADGRLLAVPIGPWSRPRAALVDVSAGTSQAVPGLRLGAYAAAAWSPTEQMLYAAGPRGRISSYAPGDAKPRAVGPRFEDPVMQLLVAE
jgi:hypothetical protein